MRRETIKTDGIRKRFVLTNEDGSVMIVALAILMLLTLIGISATTTSMIEIQISGAKKTYTDHLFQAEGAAMECVQTMQNDPNLLTNTTYVNDERTKTEAEIQTLIRDLNFANSDTPSVGTGHATLYQGVIGSLVMGQPTLHAYAVYGWHDTAQGRVIVELGYRRAF